MHILLLPWLKAWLPMMLSTVKNGNDRLLKENRRRRVAYASPVLSDTSPQKFHKMNCKVSQQSSSLSVSASPHKCFTKWIAMFRSKGPVLSVDVSPQKFHKMNCKVSQQRSSLSVDASPQKFHKMNCKVSQQRSGLVSGCFAAKVSQNELQSFTAKVRSCQWMLHRKSFTKWIAKFRSKGPVCQWMLHRKSFSKWIAKVRSKGPVLSVDASPQKFHKMNCKASQQRSGLVSGFFF